MRPYLHLLTVLLALAACEKEIPAYPPAPEETSALEATGTVHISLGTPFSPTKMAAPTDESEKRCNRWALWLFDQNGESVVYGTGEADEGISKTVLVGDYTAVAVVNYPDILIPEAIGKRQDITGWVSRLPDNAAGSLIMYGETSVSLAKDQTVSLSVNVKRLVSKVGVRKVSVNFENPFLAAKTTVLQAIYLTNVYRTGRFGTDYSAAELSGDASAWYNPMGWHLSGATDAGTDALVGDLDIQAVLTPSSPHTAAHYFYACPNATPESADTHESVWSKRSTRLVLQVAIGDKTCYYQIQVPAMARNRVYVAEEVILKKMGSLDPEQDIPGTLDVVFSENTLDWDTIYSVHENS